MTDWEWDHAKNVADRCVKMLGTRTGIERYLLGIGWDVETVARMLKYIDRQMETAETA